MECSASVINREALNLPSVRSGRISDARPLSMVTVPILDSIHLGELKLVKLQHSGSFKLRGAFANLLMRAVLLAS